MTPDLTDPVVSKGVKRCGLCDTKDALVPTL